MAMSHDFDEEWRHKKRCRKELPVIVFGKRDGGRSVGSFGTAVNPTSIAAMEVTDMIK